MCVLGGALLYPYGFVKSNSVMAAAFFEQFCVQGAWGVIPIHLMELSPASFRTFVVGTSYQLGNLVSSASSTIESIISERFPLPGKVNGQQRYQYGKVISIFMGCVFAYVIILTFVGPERRGRGMHASDDDEMTEAIEEERHGHLHPKKVDEEHTAARAPSSDESEKEHAETVEKADL